MSSAAGSACLSSAGGAKTTVESKLARRHGRWSGTVGSAEARRKSGSFGWLVCETETRAGMASSPGANPANNKRHRGRVGPPPFHTIHAAYSLTRRTPYPPIAVDNKQTNYGKKKS